MQIYKGNKNHSESYSSETTFAKLPSSMCAHRHALRKAACFWMRNVIHAFELMQLNPWPLLVVMFGEVMEP